MKKIIFFVIMAFSLTVFADGESSKNTPLVYKVYFKKLGFSKTSNKADCTYIFSSTSGTALNLASVGIGAAVGSLMANAGTLSAGTYTHICGVVKNGFDIVGSTTAGCTDAATAAGDPVTIAFGGHTYVAGATAALPSPCSVSSSDTPVSIKAPTVGEDIHVPEGVTMTTDEVEFIKQLPSSFTITGGTAPTFSLAFDVTNTLEMVTVPTAGSNTAQVAVFIQPPMPSVTAGS